MKIDIDEKISSEEILDLISEKGSDLVVEKTREILRTGILKMEEELAYIEERALIVERELQKTLEQIDEIEPVLVDTREMLKKFKDEKITLKKNLERSRDLDEKIALLNERRSLVEEKSKKVKNLEAGYRGIEEKFIRSESERAAIEEELNAKEGVLKTLKDDIVEFNERKKDFISKIPPYRDLEELRKKQKEAEEITIATKKEIEKGEQELTKIEAELSTLNEKLNELTSTKDKLTSERDDLGKEVESLKSVEDRESLEREVEELRKSKFSLNNDIENTRFENDKLTSEIDKLKEKTEEEKVFSATAEERLEELHTQREEVENAERIMKLLNLDVEVNEKFRDLVNPLMNDLSPLNTSMKELAGEYKQAIAGLRAGFEVLGK